MGYVFIRPCASATFQLCDSGWNDFLEDPKVFGYLAEPGSRHFQRFTARHCLFRHRSGYVFPEVRGHPLSLAADEMFAVPLQVSLTGEFPLPPCGGLPVAARRIRQRIEAIGAKVFRFTATLSRGVGFFSLLGVTAHPD